MLERIMERFFRKPEWFEQDGTIEVLVEAGRTPAFLPSHNGKGERILMVVPPSEVDVSIDECETQPGGAWEFFAPNGGPSKGLASLHDVSPKTAERLKQRRDSTLQIVQNRQHI